MGLPEQIDFLAGELRTWLEILAFNDELNESEQLGVEIAFPLGARRHCGQIARRLGLALCQALSDRYVSSHEGAGLWLRELTPPIGKPYCVARCDSAARALALVDAAADVIDPKVVAISSSTMSRAEIAQELAQRGVRPLSSSRQWWSDFRKLWRV